MCHTDSKIKYSSFSNICVLMFMYYTVRYSTDILNAVVRQISMLVVDNRYSVICENNFDGGQNSTLHHRRMLLDPTFHLQIAVWNVC